MNKLEPSTSPVYYARNIRAQHFRQEKMLICSS